jgi:deoxyhypusine synthase
MKSRSLHDGRTDGLHPLKSLDLSEISSFAEMLAAMRDTAFSGRQLGEAFDVLAEMFQAENCRCVLTLSGAMTVAKQGLIVCDLIDRGLVRAVVATGALIAHGLTESIGLVHYRHDTSLTDEQLFDRGYNRVYDTLEMEGNLNDVEQLVASVLSEEKPADGVWSSATFCQAIGKKLDHEDHGRGILRSAFQQNVPVFIPAFTDSEMGLDVAIAAMRDRRAASEDDSLDELLRATPSFNPFLDLQRYAGLVRECETWGILTIGGGVPRNWAQQVGPYFDIAGHRLGIEVTPPRFKYGVRICPEPVHWGGLSGCTYSEGVSWGKFVPPQEGGRFAEVHADATVAWPLLMKGVFEVLDRPAAKSKI